jgi:hypothetical protein
MRMTSKCLMGMAALVFFATQATAAERPAASARAEVVKVKTVKKIVRAPVRHEYENVAGFKGRVNDPLYAYAAEPVAPRMGPVITQWPMPNTVWW